MEQPPLNNSKVFLSATSGDDENLISFDFGATPVGYSIIHFSENNRFNPTVISIVLKNDGVVPVDWIFYFPNDLEVRCPKWH